MTMIKPSSQDTLLTLAEAGYAAALRELSDPDPWSSHRAVAQLSGHLAVMRRAVLPAARRWLDHDRALPAECLAQGRQTRAERFRGSSVPRRGGSGAATPAVEDR
jgi:hypothetical protein